MRIFIAALLMLVMANVAFATEIKLKDGITMEGTVVEVTADDILLDKGNNVKYRLKLDQLDETSLAAVKALNIPAPAAQVETPKEAAPIEQAAESAIEENATDVDDTTLEENPPQVEAPAVEAAALVAPVAVTAPAPTAAPVIQQPVTVKSNSVAMQQPQTVTVTSSSSNQRTYTHTVSPTKALGLLGAGLGVIFFICFVLHALLFGLPLFLIAQKTATPNAWLAFVPVINIVTQCNIAKKPIWWGLLGFVPLVGIIFFILIWMEIAIVRNHPKWIGILIIVPLIGIFIPWFLTTEGKHIEGPVTPSNTI